MSQNIWIISHPLLSISHKLSIKITNWLLFNIEWPLKANRASSYPHSVRPQTHEMCCRPMLKQCICFLPLLSFPVLIWSSTEKAKRHPQCQLHCVVPNRSGQCYLWISQPESKYLSWWSLPGFEGNVYLFWWRYRDWPLLFSLIIDMPFTGVYFSSLYLSTVHFRGWPLQIGGGSSEHIKSIRMCWRFP